MWTRGSLRDSPSQGLCTGGPALPRCRLTVAETLCRDRTARPSAPDGWWRWFCALQAGTNSWDTFRRPPHHGLTARGDASPAGPLRLSPAGHWPGGVLCGQPFPPRLTPTSPRVPNTTETACIPILQGLLRGEPKLKHQRSYTGKDEQMS